MRNGRPPQREALASTASAQLAPDCPGGPSPFKDASTSGEHESALGRAPLAPGSLVAGKYEVLSLLGQGGMGTVLAAKNRILDTVVAIKVLSADAAQSPGRAERLLREARLAARISHPNVVRVLDAGSLESGAPFVVMERLFGTDLERLLREHGPLPPARAASHLVEACRGLAAAHALGLVHRDLKPANLFWSENEPQGPALKVLDFGVSKLEHGDQAPLSGLTSEGTVIGSPHYMSPEQLRSSRDADQASDIWALGVILFRLVTGRYVFDAPNLPALAVAIASEAPDTASAGPALPRPLELIVRRCLEKDPQRRFASVRELERALEGYLEQAAPRQRRPLRFIVAALGVASCALVAWYWAAHSGTPATHAGDVASSAASGPVPVVTLAGEAGEAAREANPPAPDRSVAATPPPEPPPAPLEPPAREAGPKSPRGAKPPAPEAPSRAAPLPPSPAAPPPSPSRGTGVDGLVLHDESAVYDRK